MSTRSKEFLIIGLGNPGEDYQFTKHNVGFVLVDELVRRWNCGPFKKKWQALSVSAKLQDCKIQIVKPQTYMNRSGVSVGQFSRFYKSKPDQILVIHDDLDMHPGRIKLVQGGGAGGHKGIKSIVEHLGTNDFCRLKIGIGRPGKEDVHKDYPVEKYVLSSLTKHELDILESRYLAIEKGLKIFFSTDLAKAMNHLNGLK